MKNKKITRLLGVMAGTTVLMNFLSINSYAMESINFELYSTYNYEQQQQENWVKSFDYETEKEILLNTATNEKVYEVYEIINGQKVKLSIDEALKKFHLNETIDVKSPRAIFSVSSVKKVTGNAQKLSQDVSGGELGASISIGNSITISESFTVGGTTEAIKSAVRTNAGFTWSKSLTRSVTTRHNVPAGKIGYVAFKPYYYEVRGTVNGVIVGTPITEKIVARSPIKIGNICDGLEYLVYK
ncbi:MAG TPA: hypothetical protein IAB62_10655 [Candidatus Coprocola pullicola]|nr:hypothetical protein [Candidatus Coprocola pullicola]